MKGVLFDLFGTLVNYSTSRTEQGYHKTHHLLRRAGVNLPYETFLMEWSSSHAHWDRYTRTGLKSFCYCGIRYGATTSSCLAKKSSMYLSGYTCGFFARIPCLAPISNSSLRSYF